MPDMNLVSITQAVTLLESGNIVAFPTETVYGLGADANNTQAIHQIFSTKGRPTNHPLIVHLADKGNVKLWAQTISDVAWALLERFSPGPLTLVMPKQDHVLDQVTGRQNTVALRIPSHPIAQELLHAAAEQGIHGIAAPSANRFGHISPTQARHVHDEFAGNVAILDGGISNIGLESTIIDVSGTHKGIPARVLRPGHININMLQTVVNDLDYTEIATDTQDSASLSQTPRVSGMLKRHYAPTTPCFLFDDFRCVTTNDAVLSYSNSSSSNREHTGWIDLSDNPTNYAQQLYSTLRKLDSLGKQRILIQRVPENTTWTAIRDRLNRASEGSITYDERS